MANREQCCAEPGRRLQPAQLQPGTSRHQTDRQGRRPDAAERRRRRVGQAQPQQIADQPRDRADDERVADQLAVEGMPTMPRQRPHRRDIAQRHAHRDQQRHPGKALLPAEPFGQCQRDERIEAVRDLRTGRMLTRRHTRPASEREGQCNAHCRDSPGRQHEPDRLRRLQRALQDRGEEQDRKEQVVAEPLHSVPDLAIERGRTTDHEAGQDQQEIRKQQPERIHRRSVGGAKIASRLSTKHSEVLVRNKPSTRSDGGHGEPRRPFGQIPAPPARSERCAAPATD